MFLRKDDMHLPDYTTCKVQIITAAAKCIMGSGNVPVF
jgi:hypothetical protein